MVSEPQTIPDWHDENPERAKARHRQAAIFAGELGGLSPSAWTAQSSGARMARRTLVDSHPLIGDAVIGAWELARAHNPPPSSNELIGRAGVAGVVVVAHGRVWSVVARSGGPFLVLHDWLDGVWRVDGDTEWPFDMGMIVSELWEVSQGRPPFDESLIPPMPKLPWHEK